MDGLAYGGQAVWCG